ncbi:acyltransferase family protein [Carboxylicivirga taeanensis]|uniref:acyltransferase family protein n=1 Tax=Carboxylicivirga taeanensis TaxID=1416875 RepID=UPI003F6DB45D
MQRNKLLDLLKLLLAFLVITGHAKFLTDTSESLSYYLNNGLFRIVVPIFLIISGYYFSNAVNGHKVIRWFKKILLIYLIWMAVYIPMWFVMDFANFMMKLFMGWHHLWYLIAIVYAGICVYALKDVKASLLIGLAFFLLVTGYIIQLGFITDFFTDFPYLSKHSRYIYRSFIFIGFPYFYVGYYIRQQNVAAKLNRAQSILLVCVGLVLINLESYFFYNQLNLHREIDIKLSALVLAPSLFILTSKFNLKMNVDGKMLAVYSTNIYLIHVWLLVFYRTFFSLPKLLLPVIVFLTSVVLITLGLKVKRGLPGFIRHLAVFKK